MAHVEIENLISISDATRLGVSGIVREAENGRDMVVLRNNKPVAAVVNVQRLDELERLREDFLDISLATARMLTASARRHSLDDVLEQFGITREELRGVPD